MPRKKQFKYDQLEQLFNVLELPNFRKIDHQVPKLFTNDNPLVVELGCGYGEHALFLAQKFPNKNYVGIDIKGDRIYKGAKQALEANLKNLLFIRARVEDLAFIFPDGSISEIWLTFPDPRPERPKRRLTSPRFLKVYQQVLALNTKLFLRTDDSTLFWYSLRCLKQEGFEILDFEVDTNNLQFGGLVKNIVTRYQKEKGQATGGMYYLEGKSNKLTTSKS